MAKAKGEKIERGKKQNVRRETKNKERIQKGKDDGGKKSNREMGDLE